MSCAIRVEVEDFMVTGQIFREHQTASMLYMPLGRTEADRHINFSIVNIRDDPGWELPRVSLPGALSHGDGYMNRIVNPGHFPKRQGTHKQERSWLFCHHTDSRPTARGTKQERAKQKSSQ